jgi:hypothetical protein
MKDKDDTPVKFETNLVYPGDISREEMAGILGFDPGVPDGKPGLIGTVTHVDKEKGIITISTGNVPDGK